MTEPPSRKELETELGVAYEVWQRVIAAVVETAGSVESEWKPSKSNFGRLCLLKRKKRTILYLTPEKDAVLVAIVLGERAVGLALASQLPETIKTMIRDARPYAEGRGIRFPINSTDDVNMVSDLVAIKTQPK